MNASRSSGSSRASLSEERRRRAEAQAERIALALAEAEEQKRQLGLEEQARRHARAERTRRIEAGRGERRGDDVPEEAHRRLLDLKARLAAAADPTAREAIVAEARGIFEELAGRGRSDQGERGRG